MSQTVVITITTGNESVGTINSNFSKSVTNERQQGLAISDYFAAAIGGLKQCSVNTAVAGQSAGVASGTIVFSGHSTAADTILINGVTLTAVASGALNNQWNVTASSTTQAVAVASAINASTTALVSGSVVAVASGSTVTISALVPGVIGDAVTIAKGTDAGSVMTVSGARLTGGTASTNTYHFGL